MKAKTRTVLTLLFLAVAIAASTQVSPGIETLRDNGFDLLRGKRVGLITNPTGVDNSLRSTIDILHEAPEVELVALFAPEHGVRGDVAAGAKVADAVDKRTGVKIHSMYGRNKVPTPEQLAEIDVLVYDIQDNGCRSYTFISTMGLAMEQCARLGKEFMVLDRPNPLGGDKVEGPLVDADCRSLVSQFPVPYIYGLTPGELATLLNGEGMIADGKKARLTVVPMKGWRRSMQFEDTGMPWVMTSPHIPEASTALYYPATGIIGELGTVSIGVGYTKPFKFIGAPWIDSERFAEAMNALGLPGLMFRPVHYKPYYSNGSGANLGGVEVYVTDPEAAPLTLTQFYALQELARLYPAHKPIEEAEQSRQAMFDKVVGSKRIRAAFTRRHEVADILPLWNEPVAEFIKTKTKYHLYE